MAKAICSASVLYDYFETFPQNCRERYIKKTERINQMAWNFIPLEIRVGDYSLDMVNINSITTIA